ncbi:hypothetical protein ASPVEDRAFT_42343 [Aspergillus versicolor CBS 583.65]|uniref:N-acetyltransferase domain-containing protein n=1 Tax=Aspergillus versicolor CBS 583.65 TaxID=1036611 RepID=A0A1L9PMR4_ASPVE|nr:uncharacterized protein ASPVEDRAFT_42343 [Aspergillus versicolor CBS 583.65]OJJ02827.1 hypothetical protein ASPVEDRAFT_42343 [Aspergillus versicolor CBS 583.65]
MSSTTITPAAPTDSPVIKALVIAAFTKYIERMGKPPAPMLADYTNLSGVFILTATAQPTQTQLNAGSNTILGSVTLTEEPETDSIRVNNLVVDPAMQGRGYGRVLLEFAETRAREAGRGALTLATNVKMTENIALYTKIGFVEIGRAVQDGYERVFMRKVLV